MPYPFSNSASVSTSNQSAGPSISTDNFTAIFNAASTEYARVTGRRLDAHPFAAQLDACRDSPNAVSDLLRSQARAFSKFRKGEEKLMAVLDPTVHILSTFSGILGEGVGLVSPTLSSRAQCQRSMDATSSTVSRSACSSYACSLLRSHLTYVCMLCYPSCVRWALDNTIHTDSCLFDFSVHLRVLWLCVSQCGRGKR